MKKVVVLGGGIGGLSVAWMLSRTGQFQVIVVEKEPVIGGMCGTFKYKDFYLDYGAHKIYSVIPGIMEEFRLLMGDGNYIKYEKKNRIYLFNQYLDYPVKILDMLLKMGFNNIFSCGFSLFQNMRNKVLHKRNIDNYEDFIIDKFGRKLYDLVFKSLAEKTWGYTRTLSADIAKTRIPSTNIFDLVFRTVGLKKESDRTNAKFFYYPKGGFGKIIERMAQEIVKNNGTILTNSIPLGFELQEDSVRKVILNSSGTRRELDTDLVISTIHFDNLISLIPSNSRILCNKIFDLINDLEYRSLILVYLSLNKKHIMDEHWIFFPDNNLVFGRVFEQKNMDIKMVDKEKTVICCDFTDYENGRLYKQDDATLVNMCCADLEKIGLIKSDWIEDSLVKRFPKFYPRYNVGYKTRLKTIYNELKKVDNLLLSGRIGFYNYNNADHCLDMGRFITENLVKGNRPDCILTELEKRVSEYRIVD